MRNRPTSRGGEDFRGSGHGHKVNQPDPVHICHDRPARQRSMPQPIAHQCVATQAANIPSQGEVAFSALPTFTPQHVRYCQPQEDKRTCTSPHEASGCASMQACVAHLQGHGLHAEQARELHQQPQKVLCAEHGGGEGPIGQDLRQRDEHLRRWGAQVPTIGPQACRR